jgi:hypothetical protein
LGKRNAYRVLVGKPGKVDNIKMLHREIGWDGMDWIDLAHWRTLVNTVMNLRVP